MGWISYSLRTYYFELVIIGIDPEEVRSVIWIRVIVIPNFFLFEYVNYFESASVRQNKTIPIVLGEDLTASHFWPHLQTVLGIHYLYLRIFIALSVHKLVSKFLLRELTTKRLPLSILLLYTLDMSMFIHRTKYWLSFLIDLHFSVHLS